MRAVREYSSALLGYTYTRIGYRYAYMHNIFEMYDYMYGLQLLIYKSDNVNIICIGDRKISTANGQSLIK